jgi:hypothetical protein
MFIEDDEPTTNPETTMTTMKMTASELDAVRTTSRATQSMYDRANAEFKKRYPKIPPEDGLEEFRFGSVEITLVGVVRKRGMAVGTEAETFSFVP